MLETARCRLCGTESTCISRQMGACATCIRTDPARALPLAQAAGVRNVAAGNVHLLSDSY